MTEQNDQTTVDASLSTSGPEVDEAANPGRVRPVKLTGSAPEPVESKPERIGPEKIRVNRPKG